MHYEMQIDTQQRLSHMEYLILSEQAKDKKEAFDMTRHHADIIPYSLNKVVIEINVDENYENLQAIKCFHVWSLHSVNSLDSVFFRHLLKGKYTFSKVLFDKEI